MRHPRLSEPPPTATSDTVRSAGSALRAATGALGARPRFSAGLQFAVRMRGRPVVLAGILMVLAQLSFRAWAVFGSWFQVDDFVFMSRVMSGRLTPHMLLEPHNGHVMPGGIFLSWVNAQIDPLNFALPATTLLVMQAAASFGCLALLVHAFGERRAILLPLAIYLFTVITLPAFIWWAAGVNQLPLQIALFWGVHTHLSYLRTRRPRYAVHTMLIVVVSLLFFEKTLLLFGVFAILAVAYFAEGDTVTRVKGVWRTYRPGVLVYSAVGCAYLVLYIVWGLNFDPNNANNRPLTPVVTKLAGQAFATGVLGGPLHWRYMTPKFPGPFAFANPADMVVVVSWVTLLGAGLHLARTRTRSLRAWLIPLWFLASDVLLLVAGRPGLPGQDLALDYRYQTELAGATALALGLALLPLRGARQSAETAQRSWFFDVPVRVGGATVVIVALGTISSVQFATHWQDYRRSRDYFATVFTELRSLTTTVPLAGAPLPVKQMPSAHVRYPHVSPDSLYVISETGFIRPAAIPAVRSNLPGPDGPCGYRLGQAATTIRLNGPVLPGGGWWMRMGYYSNAAGPITIAFGDRRYDARVAKGLHSLYLDADASYDAVRISGLDPGTSMCMTDLSVGMPFAAEPP